MLVSRDQSLDSYCFDRLAGGVIRTCFWLWAFAASLRVQTGGQWRFAGKP
jgi:hypothetical protein